MPVLLQTALFPFAATLEVTGNTLAIYDQDGGAQSRELIERLTHMPAFTTVVPVAGEAGMTNAITGQQALIGLIIPQDFSRRLARSEQARLQLIIDGRRSNGGQVAAGYINEVIARWQSEGKAQPELAVRHLYNPNIEFSWHILPSLVAIITTVGCLIVTALSVAREREEGTFDQLLVSPLTAGWIMAGKAVPGILVAVGQGTIVALAARFLYQVPFGGSTTLLMAGMVCYGLALAGIGLFVSSLCSTQQQAFLGVFSFMVPAVILAQGGLPQGSRLVGGLAPALAPARHRRCHPLSGAGHVPPPYRLMTQPLPGVGLLPAMPALDRGRAGHGNRQLVYPFMHRFEFPRITPEEIYK